MAFIYLRLVDNDFGTEVEGFGEDFLYNYGMTGFEMPEEEIKKRAAIFIAGYNTYLTADRKDWTPVENFIKTLDYMNMDPGGLRVIKSSHWPNETYEKTGSDDDHGSVVIDFYNKKCYLV